MSDYRVALEIERLTTVAKEHNKIQLRIAESLERIANNTEKEVGFRGIPADDID